MAFLVIVICLIGVLSLDDLWRGTRIGDIVNALLAVIAFAFLVCLGAAFISHMAE